MKRWSVFSPCVVGHYSVMLRIRIEPRLRSVHARKIVIVTDVLSALRPLGLYTQGITISKQSY